jgi:hypothetical protein
MASLAPPGAYKLLGPAVSEIGGTIVGLDALTTALEPGTPRLARP